MKELAWKKPLTYTFCTLHFDLNYLQQLIFCPIKLQIKR
jgi:hypothetical protein